MSRFGFLIGCGLSVAGLAGCQSGSSPLAALGGGDNANAQTETITSEELRAYCPRVELREGTAYFRTYDGDPVADNVIYQASIDDVTRSCTYNGAQITMNVAVAGRVTLGPKGNSGKIAMPIRIAVVKAGEVVYSQLHTYDASVQPLGATQFVFNDPNVTFPAPTQRDVIVYAGYDEGPPPRIASR